MGSVGYGTATDAGIVYVLEIGVSAASRRSVGMVERLYEYGSALTFCLVSPERGEG